MATNLLKQMLNLFDRRKSSELATAGDHESPSPVRHHALIKSRPLTLEQKYAHLASEERCEEQFFRLKEHIYRHLNTSVRPQVTAKAWASTPKYIREAGRLASNRPYFYLQPLNQDGLLFERTTHGWMVCKARKVIESSSFLRAYEDWDHVTLHESSDGHVRLSSVRLGFKLVSILVYQEKLCGLLDSLPNP